MASTPPNPEFAPIPAAAAATPAIAEDRGKVAPVWHTIVFIIATLALTGLQAKNQPAVNSMNLPTKTPLYTVMILFELILLAYVWLGVRLGGKTVRNIVGGKWSRWQDFGIDIAIVIGFWFVVVGALKAMSFVLGQNDVGLEAVKSLLPKTSVEMVMWVCVSVTAGFCEEFVFRGYLQRQFLALTGKIEAAVVLQAIIFGTAHLYQGWKGALTITVYGALFGILAAWRKSLRPGMIQHAAQDSLVGLVGGFLLRHHKFPSALLLGFRV